MRARRRSVLPLLLSLALSSKVAWAGPWLPGAGHGYVQLRQGWSYTQDRFDADGNRGRVMAVAPDGSVVPSAWQLVETNLYAEAGVLSRLAFTLDWNALRGLWQPLPGQAALHALGVSDLTLGAKLLVFDDVLTLAIVAAVTAPTGSSTARLPLGQGDTRTELAISVGKTFEPQPIFVDASIGFVLRTSAQVTDPRDPARADLVSYSPEVRYLLRGGYSLRRYRRGLERLVFSLRLDGRQSTGAPAEDGLGLLTPATSAFLRLGGEIDWMPQRRVELSLSGGGFVYGRALPAVNELALGIAFLY